MEVRAPWPRSSVASCGLAGRRAALVLLFVAAVPRCAHGGCVKKTTMYQPFLANVSETQQGSMESCQLSCALTTGCYYAVWNKKAFTCNYAGLNALPTPDWRHRSAPSVCPIDTTIPNDPCVNEVARDGFPGINAEASNAAWASGAQPKTLQCWPKDTAGNPAACKFVTVVEDSEEGWPGRCREMQTLTNVGSCDESCEENSECASWSTSNSGTCYQGLGTGCYLGASWKPARAQRLVHGTVRVLMNLTGWQIQGLTKLWNPFGDGYFFTQEESTNACKKACYSEIWCTIWSYSSWYGCWVEDKDHQVQYPLTLDVATRDSKFAQSSAGKDPELSFGEMIQHICAEDGTTQYPGEQWPAPYCALQGYSMTPLDVDNPSFVITKNALLCQERCQDSTNCTYYTFVQATGQCHMEGIEATIVDAPGYQSGPKDCPLTTPRPYAGCNFHSGCSALGFTGECCPNMDGEMLGCCEYGLATTPAPETNRESHMRGGPQLGPQIDYPYAEIAWTIPNVTYAELTASQKESMATGYASAMSETSGVASQEVYDLTGTRGEVSLKVIEGSAGAAMAGILATSGSRSVATYQELFTTQSFKDQLMQKTMDSLNPGGALGSLAAPVNALKGYPYINGLSVVGKTQPEIDKMFGINFWTKYGWLTLALSLLCCALCAAAVCFFLHKRKSRAGPRSRDIEESGLSSAQEPVIEDDLVEELLHPEDDDGPVGGIHDVGDSKLPFPEAGLPNHSRLPFPDAGLPAVHGNPETVYDPRMGGPLRPPAGTNGNARPFPGTSANVPFR